MSPYRATQKFRYAQHHIVVTPRSGYSDEVFVCWLIVMFPFMLLS